MTRLSSSIKGRIAASAGVFVVLASTALAPAAGLDSVDTRESHRPHSADAAERWWSSCTDSMPRSADAAERTATGCW